MKQLQTYQEIERKLPQTQARHLLLGNGFSVGCDPIFQYHELYEFAKKEGIGKKAEELFKSLGTSNFEGVMQLLNQGQCIADLYKLTPSTNGFPKDDLDKLKKALISAISKTHLKSADLLNDEKRKNCMKFIKPYQNIFSTNYDLLLYWTILGEPALEKRDCFGEPDIHNAKYVSFNRRLKNDPGILFLHGALHLYVEDGETRKHCWGRTGTPILDMVKQGLESDQYPLFVAEGSSEKKMEQIKSSPYLFYCWQKFCEIKNPLVIYGHSLGKTDHHIVDAISRNCLLEKVYIGIFGKDSSILEQTAESMCSERESLLKKRKKGTSKELQIEFFDSSSASIWEPKEMAQMVGT